MVVGAPTVGERGGIRVRLRNATEMRGLKEVRPGRIRVSLEKIKISLNTAQVRIAKSLRTFSLSPHDSGSPRAKPVVSVHVLLSRLKLDLFSGEDEVGEGLTSAGRFTRVSHNQSGGIEEHAIVLGESIHNIIDEKR